MKRLMILIPLCVLAACNDSAPAPAEPAEQGGNATGEVLGGTISDDMIPLEQLTSRSPPADPEPSESAEGSASTANSAPASAPEPAPDSEPAPASEPESQEAEAAPATPAPDESSDEE